MKINEIAESIANNITNGNRTDAFNEIRDLDPCVAVLVTLTIDRDYGRLTSNELFKIVTARYQ